MNTDHLDLATVLGELSGMTAKAEQLWQQHMAEEGLSIDPQNAVHVWFALEHDTFYRDPPWCACWYYFDPAGRTTAFLYEFRDTPFAAARALRDRMVA